MKKLRKVRDFYTLNPELYKTFLDIIEKNNLDKSKLIESFIKEYIEKKVNL